MVKAAAGEARNAWRELWLRRPQDKGWAQAERLRREQAALSLPVRSALIDQSRMHAEQQVERRVSKHRRTDERLTSDCAQD